MTSLRPAWSLVVTAALLAGCAADTPGDTPTPTTTTQATTAPPTTTSLSPTNSTTTGATNNTTATSAPTTTAATTPTMNLTKTEASDVLTVDATAGGANWLQIEIRALDGGVAFKLENGTTTVLPLATWWPATNTSNPVEVGNPLVLCRPAGAGAGVSVAVRHGPSETVHYTGSFTDLAAC